MKADKFKNQLDKLYSKNYSWKKALEGQCYSNKHFMDIAEKLMDNEVIEALAPIVANPLPGRKSPEQLRDWFVILTDKRLIVASPTLFLHEMTFVSYKYSAIVSVEAAKWNSIYIKVNTSLDMIRMTGTYLYYSQRDDLIRIIERHMYD